RRKMRQLAARPQLSRPETPGHIAGSRSRRRGAAGTPRRRGTPGWRDGGSRPAPGRASDGAPLGSQRAEHPRDLAEDLDVVGVDRLVGLVLGLQTNTTRVAEEALHSCLVGRFVFPDQGNHDLAVAGVLLAADDDVVALEDAGVLHRVAADAEEELLATTGQRLRHRQIRVDVLL